ncbi:MAG: hypothetical protein M1827_006177 [Pycnora praestabilis]|nr:MAG: hypothetical protein M1827_006177 [Pycnora praestabilis]
MPSLSLSFPVILSCFILIALLIRPTRAFGAGNIASTARIEGQNWRHGDIEDTLLTLLMSRAAGGKKFSKMDVKRVYFGNWLRDYSQAVDVGTVKMVSAEAIRILLWVLGFLSFGYGTKEFEVTSERLGCYRPEEHIDNPKDYADNLDARQYDPRLRGPVDERRELSINPQTGLKNYIASEGIGITTSAGLIRDLFSQSIQLGRQYARSKNRADLYEALRLLGTGCHCLEDYSAHSNYTELALIEMGERGVFPHVGHQTQITLHGARQPIYPIVTGTFGGVDFLHSVMGEFSDKATQSEIQELEGTIQQSQNSGQGNTSIIKELLDQLPDGLFGGKDQTGKADELQENAQAAQMQHAHITPRKPEDFTRQMQEISKQIYPILEWHDEIMQSINEFIEKVPILPDLIEQLQDEINIFVFSLLAPFVLPIINQVKTELATGSSEVIQSSKEKQLVVFRNDHSSDPTHSMLSKDHFSNILNEPAGKIASQVLKWVVPQIIACWDDERIGINRTLTRVVNGVFHHPALRDYGDDGAVDGRRLMFGVVQIWWGGKDERERMQMRDQLSRNGVEQGRNHKEGVHDTGHGCGKPLGTPNTKPAGSSGVLGGPAAGAVLGGLAQAFGGQGKPSNSQGGPIESSGGGGGGIGGFGMIAGEAVGAGALGGLVGGLVGGVEADLLGGAFGGGDDERKAYRKEEYGEDGSYTQTVTETGYNKHQPRSNQQKYGQAQYSQTSFPGGGRREEYQRFEQDGQYGAGGYGIDDIRISRPTYEGGYEQTLETRHEKPGGSWESDVLRERRDAGGEFTSETQHFGLGFGDNEGSDFESQRRKKEKKHHKKKHHHHKDDSSSEEEGGQAYGQQQDRFGEERREYQQETGRVGKPYAEERVRMGGGNQYREEPQEYDGGSRYEGGHQGFGVGVQVGGDHQEYGGGRRYEERRQGYGGGNLFKEERQEYGRPNLQQETFGNDRFNAPPQREYEQERPAYGGGGSEMPGGFGGEAEFEEEEGFEGNQEFGEVYGRAEGFGDGGYGEVDEFQERHGYGDNY